MDLLKLTNKAIAYGMSKGLSREQAEDYSQEWLINFAVKKTGQTLLQCYVDYMRFEYGRNSHYKKHDYTRLVEDIGGQEVIPEVYLIDCSPLRLKKLLGTKHLRLLKLMIAGDSYIDRCKKMQTSNNTILFWQREIRRKMNGVFGTDLSVHRCGPR